MITASNGAIGFDKAVVTLDDDCTVVTIRRGMLGRKETTIPVSRITMLGWKHSIAGSGHIEFVAASVDGYVRFAAWKHGEFEVLRDAINAKITQ
jgi:hypothetical protein